MAIVVETGSGVTGANSYGAVAGATTFHADRANDAWAAANASVQTSALIRATDDIEANFRATSGARLTTAQGLQFPRDDGQGVPAAVLKATYILALEALSGPLRASAERGIKSTKESLEGVVSTETVYDDAAVAPVDAYPAITALLADVAAPRFIASTTATVTYGTVIR